MCLQSCFRNLSSIFFFVLTFIEISNSLGSNDAQNASCKFAMNDGQIINLSPLLSSDQPLIGATNTSLYIYHPCTDVSLNSVQVNDCKKGYGLCYFVAKNASDKILDFNKVLLNVTQGSFFLLALNEESVFRENRFKQPEIVYKHHNASTISTYVRLDCNENIENYKLSIDKTSPLEHILTLSSKHICIETPQYMSGGTVFFIILVVFLLLYFVGGVLVLKFIRGATGIEMIPNHEFWCSLPQLAKDGFKHLTNCGKNTPDSYEKI